MENLFNDEENEAPFGPLPPCPKSSPSNSIRLMPDDEMRTGSDTSSSANLSSIPKTEVTQVEVFEFREVEASPCRNSKEAGAQTTSSTAQSVANSPPSKPDMARSASPAVRARKSGHSSSAGVGTSLPQHVASRLKCEKGKSKERKEKEPPPKAMDELDEDELELEFPSEKSSACDCPAHIHDRESPLLIAQAGFSSVFDPVPHETGASPIGSYSYGCLMKKWSL